MTVVSAPLEDRIEGATKEALSLCYQCGTCTAVCPMSISIRRLLRGAQLGAKESSSGAPDLWHCATCRLCEVSCPRGVQVTDVVHALRVISFEEHKAPERLEKALWGVYEEGNSWGGKKGQRGAWAAGVPKAEPGRKTKFVLYTGCAASYDPRLQKVAKSVAGLLGAAGAEFQVLGDRESCCGDTVYQVGEEGFLQELVESNSKALGEAGESVVTLSPHCYNMFESVYPKYGKAVPAVHYTQLLAELIDGGRLKPAGAAAAEVTYHDPCYLGRYHGVYEQPRKVLESIPGVRLVEMKASKANATCCGGGGGLMWTEFEGERPSRGRVAQAAETGASTLATSCPYCVLNFEDAARTEGSGVKVADVAELLSAAMGGK